MNLLIRNNAAKEPEHSDTTDPEWRRRSDNERFRRKPSEKESRRERGGNREGTRYARKARTPVEKRRKRYEGHKRQNG